VPSNVDAPAYPDLFMSLDMIEKPLQRTESSWTAEQPAVHADGHHAWRIGAFLVEYVEGIAQVGVELLRGVEALRCREAHVVGFEGIGHDEM